jgi:hypothetical protein
MGCHILVCDKHRSTSHVKCVLLHWFTACLCACTLRNACLCAAALQALVGQALAAALRGSGVFQVLLEGSLLLLGVDPAAYSQAPDIQLVLSGSLGVAVRATNSLTQNLAPT